MERREKTYRTLEQAIEEAPREVRELLDEAREIAEQLQHKYVGSEHVFIALLNSRGSKLYQAFGMLLGNKGLEALDVKEMLMISTSESEQDANFEEPHLSYQVEAILRSGIYALDQFVIMILKDENIVTKVLKKEFKLSPEEVIAAYKNL